MPIEIQTPASLLYNPPPSRGRIGGCGHLIILTAQIKTGQGRCEVGFATTLYSTKCARPACHKTLDISCNYAPPPLCTSPSTKSPSTKFQPRSLIAIIATASISILVPFVVSDGPMSDPIFPTSCMQNFNSDYTCMFSIWNYCLRFRGVLSALPLESVLI